MEAPHRAAGSWTRSASPVGQRDGGGEADGVRDHGDYAAAVLADGTLASRLDGGHHRRRAARRLVDGVAAAAGRRPPPSAPVIEGNRDGAHFSAGGAAARSRGRRREPVRVGEYCARPRSSTTPTPPTPTRGGTVARSGAIDVDRGAAGDRVLRHQPREATRWAPSSVRCCRTRRWRSSPRSTTRDRHRERDARCGQARDAADATEADERAATLATWRRCGPAFNPPGCRATSTSCSLPPTGPPLQDHERGRTTGGAWSDSRGAAHAAAGGRRAVGRRRRLRWRRRRRLRTAFRSARVVASRCGARGPTPAALRS